MDEHLDRLRNGGTFAEFVDATRTQWRRIAMRLLQRWKVPCDVELEDVVQELLLAVIEYLPDFDPTKGKTISHYVVWNARRSAEKWIHAQRGALRRDGKAKSRHPIAMSRLGKVCDPSSPPIEEWLWVEPEQEIDAEKARHIAMIDRIFAGDERVRETVRIIVLVEGDLTAAATDILARRSELGLRVASYAEAYALARKVVDALIAA